jgi:hypothetical protein
MAGILLTLLLNVKNAEAVDPKNKVENEARQTVVNYFSAQKSGNIEQMIENSTYFLDISNLKEFYTRINKEHPLLQGTITNAQVINDSLVIISSQQRFKDRITISTRPVYKENNKWKFLVGIPPQGFTEVNSFQRLNSLEKEAFGVINNYISDFESGNIDNLLKHLYIVSPNDKKQVKQHFVDLQKDSARMNLKQINIFGKNLALVKIESDFGNYKVLETIPMYKESNQWKIVFFQRLNQYSIRVGNKVQEVK